MAAAVAANAARKASESMVYVEEIVWLEVGNEWKERLEEDVGIIRSDLDLGTFKYCFDWVTHRGQDIAKLGGPCQLVGQQYITSFAGTQWSQGA